MHFEQMDFHNILNIWKVITRSKEEVKELYPNIRPQMVVPSLPTLLSYSTTQRLCNF